MQKKISYFRRSGMAALLTFSFLLPLLSETDVQAAAGAMNGNGSPGSPYIIEDEADLLQFASIVNSGDFDANGRLNSDITITDTWTPIGGTDSDSAYTGIFTGNGYTVTFTSGTSGLFGRNNGTIQNVTTAGHITGADYAGGIAAVNQGMISSCQNHAAVSVSSPVSFAGGITGVNIGTIENSENTGLISSQNSGSTIGGIAGAAREGRIKGCTNNGSVSLAPLESDPEYAEGCTGGIAGLNYNADIELSANYGSVNNTDASGYTGGITGLNNGSVSNCVNGSTVEGSYYAGGITGYNFLNEKAGEARINNVLNHGTVTANETGYGAICGINHQGVIYDSYYLENTASAGIGTSDNNGTTVKTASALSGGEVAYQLNGNRSADPVWYQTLESDPAPVLDSGHGIVYRQSKDGIVTYSNDPDSHTDHEFDESGECGICDYKSVSLYGHSLTLDGALGLNYYFYIDPMYYQDDSYTITVSFTLNKRTETDTFDPSCVLYAGNAKTPQVYGFQLYIRSDEMTSPIHAELQIKQEDKTVVSLSDDGTFRGYDYLLKLYQDDTYSVELKALAQALATYDYYANEHFKYQNSYEPQIPLLTLDSVTAETLQSFTQSVEDQNNYPAKHYALSMQFLSEHVLYLYMISEDSLDASRVYMGYKTHGSAEDYVYVKTEQSGKYYRASTLKVPASKLDIMWDCAFFLKQDDGSYTQITSIKTAGPLSYAVSNLRPGTKESARKLNQALYLYYETTKTYFDSVSQE